MSVSRLRLENRSLYYYIKTEVIATEFIEQISNETLIYDPSLGVYKTESLMEPSPVSNGRGWVYFDDSTVGSRIVVDKTQEQTSKVSLDVGGTFDVNYKRGYIINPSITPSTVSYYWHYVSVLPQWPQTTPPPLPIVTLGVDQSERSGFQLGGGHKDTRTVYFNIFATSVAERDDISELILSSIYNRRVDIWDFSDGEYLNYNGTFNDNISLPVSSVGNMFFVDAFQKNLYAIDDFSDINAYRSVVTGIYESFVN